MTKEEYLLELEECIRGEVSDYELADSMSYYSTYFKDEMSMGKTESEIIQSLGSPRLVGRSIIDARGEKELQERAKGHYYDSSSSDAVYDPDQEIEKEESLVTSAGRIVVYASVMALVFAAFFLVARFLLPVILVGIGIAFLVRLFRRL